MKLSGSKNFTPAKPSTAFSRTPGLSFSGSAKTRCRSHWFFRDKASGSAQVPFPCLKCGSVDQFTKCRNGKETKLIFWGDWKDNLKKCVPTHVLPATWKKSQCWSIPTISSGPSKKDILRCFQPANFCKLMDKAYHEDCEHPNTPILLGRQSKSLCQSDLRWLSDIAKVAPPSELNKSQVQWPPANAGLPWCN